LPILGICGGLQLIAMAHGAALGPMRRLQKGEADPNEGFASGYFKEWGFVPVRVLEPDPLFEGLGQKPVFLEAHYWDVKEVPPGFELLASSDACRIQAIRQTGRLVYGTQFHPEAYLAGKEALQSWLVNFVYPKGHTDVHADGRRLLANFFTLAGVA
jgi:GMP synthase (glutamine-hydrolysing)